MIELSVLGAAMLEDLTRAHAEATRGSWNPTPWFLDDLMMRLAWIVGRNRELDETLDELRRAGYLFTEGKDEMFYPEVPEVIPERPSFDQLGMETARLWATRSSDEKHKVGCCLMSSGSHTVVSLGFNGRFPGSQNESRVSGAVGGSEFIHSEINALLRARWAEGESHTAFVTHEPCHECALAILASRRINRVVYAQEYAGDGKRRRGSEILREAGVEVTQWTN